MPEQDQRELWQVEVGGDIYQAPFGELPDWIAEGSLQPDDKIRKGNLRWIEAKRVPRLIPFFDAKAKGSPIPRMQPPEKAVVPAIPVNAEPVSKARIEPRADTYSIEPSPIEVIIAQDVAPVRSATADPNFCSVHQNAPTAYRCVDCGANFCKPCPNSFGGTVKLCPACGGMCRTIGEIRQATHKAEFRSGALAVGFGFGDLVAAFKHPLKFKTSLVVGAIMFMFFMLGQSAGAMGGIMMAASGVISLMFANMMIFGVLSNTVDAFAHGHLDSNFMPEFEDFSLLDDVVKPLFLSIGVYISSFGPFLLTLVVGVYLIINAVGSTSQSIQSDLEKIPGTNYYSAKDTVKQSQEVRSVIGSTANKATARIDEEEAIENGQTNIATATSELDEKEINDLTRKAEAGRKAQLESVMGKTADTRDRERRAMISSFLSLAPPLVVIAFICFLWGLFYFPAACAVAGYTRSFTATINPMVGLDTIKRLGSIYAKILMMTLALIFIFGLVETMLALIFAAFDLPGFGNIVAGAIGSLFIFYLAAVFACMLGYAMFKGSDRLNLPS